MTRFRASFDRLISVGLGLLCAGVFLQTGGLVAADPERSEEPGPTEAEWKPLRAEKPAAAMLPKPRQETREERRERIRTQAAGGLGSMMNLIGIPQIQRELELSAAQQKELSDQSRRIHLYVRSQFLDVPKMPKDEQTAAMRKLRLQTQPVVEKRQKEMLKVLTGEQRLRLLGISLQMRGPKSLIDEAVIELLELTPEQVEAILVILEEHDAKLQKLLAERTPFNPKTPLIAVQPVNSRKSMEEKVEAQILEVLTESQRAKFKELQGEPYAVQSTGRLPTLIDPSEKDEPKSLKELNSDN